MMFPSSIRSPRFLTLIDQYRQSIEKYHQNSNSSKKLEVRTIEKCWTIFPKASLSLFMFSAMLTMSSLSSSLSRIELEPICKQASGSRSMMKLRSIKPLNGDRFSFSMCMDDLKVMEMLLAAGPSSFWAVGLS